MIKVVSYPNNFSVKKINKKVLIHDYPKQSRIYVIYDFTTNMKVVGKDSFT